ncbi:MAG: hypothetical protein GY749_48300 [Desulfobacteraceae bacterium]|nr:hypothetical protein [Desulfobacteraceae bacterium]
MDKTDELIALLSNMPYILDVFIFGISGAACAVMFWLPVTLALFKGND